MVLVLEPQKGQDPVLCWCSDFWMLNEETKELQDALPTIKNNFDILAGGKIFSSLDSANAYFSIKAQDSSPRYLNFLANGKLFRYTHLPIQSEKFGSILNSHDHPDIVSRQTEMYPDIYG